MELRSRVFAEVETGDSDPGVPGLSSPLTEGSGEPVPVSAMTVSLYNRRSRGKSLTPKHSGVNGAT